MSEKKLWQVGWKGGQTEGDTSPETVQELLNVDLDVEGQLHPRGVLTENTSRLWTHTGAADIPIDMKYLTNPADSTMVYRVQLCTTSVKIIKDSDGSTVATLTFAAAEGWTGASVIDTTSTMEINGSDIYVVAIIAGAPAGVFSIVYTSTKNRFAPPNLCDGTTYDQEYTDAADSWLIFSPTGITPVLAAYEVTDSIYDSSGTVMWTSPDKDTYYNSANTWCAGSAVKVAMAYKQINDRAPSDSPLAAFFTLLASKQVMTAEYAVQFVFVNGQHSKLSNLASINVNFDVANLGCAIGTTISASTGLSRTVRAINVYRRLIRKGDSVLMDTDLELMYTAIVYSTLLAEANTTATESTVTQKYKYYTGVTAYNGDGSSGLTTALLDGSNGSGAGLQPLLPIGSKRSFSGSASFTSGWFQYFGTTYTFVPKCLIASGTHNAYVGTLTDSDSDDLANAKYYKLSLSGICIYGRWANLGSNVECVCADQRTLTPSIDIASPRIVTPKFARYDSSPWTTHWNGFGPDIGFTVIKATAQSSCRANDQYSTTSHTASGTFGTTTQTPLVLYVDDTQAAFTYAMVSGVEENELSVVNPRVISIAGGRMVGLNVVQDSETKRARLVYSEFRRFNTFRKTNYIDYGPRDDGVGVAMAYFAGRLLVMHTTSSYVLDISGGSDMSWREIAAYQDIGAISGKAVVITSVGVFFASQADVYWFNGDKITKISELEGRRVSAAYRAMTKANITLLWCSTLRQLWVCDKTTVLVFDMDLGAWHKHTLGEFSTAGQYMTPLRFNNLSNTEFMTTKYSLTDTDKLQSYALDYTGTTVPFQWGVTTGPINMGSSEVIKKSKSLYVDTIGLTTQPAEPWYLAPPNERIPWAFDVWYSDVNGSSDKTFVPVIGRVVNRVKISNRSYWLNVKILTKLNGSTYWRGAIESLGLSYRPKRLK